MARLAIFFPGLGYTTDKPILYFGRDVAYESGYTDYRNLSYETKNKEGIRDNADIMKKVVSELYLQAESQLSDINWSLYEDVLFISKSIGTIIASAYAKQHNLTWVKHVLYTPLKLTYEFNPVNAIAFIGTQDTWSDVREIEALSKEDNIPLEIYTGCNHSMETEDVFRNIEILKDIMEKTKTFINGSIEGN